MMTVISSLEKFDINDNPYGEYKLHRYTNINDPKNETVDKIIPLEACNADG